MKFVVKIFLNCEKNKNSFTFLNKKKKIKIFSRKNVILENLNSNNINLELIEKKNTQFQKIQICSKGINSINNLEKFHNFIRTRNTKIYKIFQIKKNFNTSYPLEQIFLSSSINKLEQIGSSYFCLIFLGWNRIYSEFKLSENLIFPQPIFTNLMVLNNFEKIQSMTYDLVQCEPKIFEKKFDGKLKNSINEFKICYQVFFSKKSNLKILTKGVSFLSIFFKTKKNTSLRKFGSFPVFYLNFEKESFFLKYFFKKKNIFEFNKANINVFKINYEISFKNSIKIKTKCKINFPRIKLIIQSQKTIICNKKNYNILKYSKNTRENIFSFVFLNKISCSILISSKNISKISRILESVEFKKIEIEIFQIENIQQLSFLNLINFISDLRKNNQRIIWAVGDLCDIENFDIIYSILNLPKFHCLKFFSCIKLFSKKEKKIFFLKKCIEKNFTFFPLSPLPYSKNLSYNSKIKMPKIDLYFQFQKKTPVFVYGIENSIHDERNFFNYELKNSILNYRDAKSNCPKIKENKNLNLIIYYTNSVSFRENLLQKKVLNIKKIEKILFFQIFLYLALFSEKKNHEPKIYIKDEFLI